MNRLMAIRLSDRLGDQSSKLPFRHIPLMEHHATDNYPVSGIHLRKAAVDLLLKKAIRQLVFRPAGIRNLCSNRFQCFDGNGFATAPVRTIFDAFADISAAASATQKEEQQIDDKTFGKLIQEEIDRINAKNGYTAPEPAKQETKAEETAPADHSDAEPPKAEQAEPGPAQDESSGHATEPVSQEKATADVPVSPVPVFEQKPAAETKQAEETKPEVFSSLEEFMTYVADLGIVTKDNREKSGCLWVKADPRIDQILEKQKFGDKRFKYSTKSKTLGGEPGWYY